jgi:hypothetical protein
MGDCKSQRHSNIAEAQQKRVQKKTLRNRIDILYNGILNVLKGGDLISLVPRVKLVGCSKKWADGTGKEAPQLIRLDLY